MGGTKAGSGEQFAALVDIPLSTQESCASSNPPGPVSPSPPPSAPPTSSPSASGKCQCSSKTCNGKCCPFSNTPKPGICSCGTSWSEATTGGARCDASSS